MSFSTRQPLADAHHVTLRCVDAATKAPIPEFRVSRSAFDSTYSTLAILDHPRARQPHRGQATFEVVPDPGGPPRGVFVLDAPGHGTVTMPIPDEAKDPLVVELPAECFLVGRVLDAETGKPAAGVAVCALPTPAIFGSDGDAGRTGVLTDADGRYRIGGLAAGLHHVRLYATGRPIPPNRSVAVMENAVNELDLEVPKERFIDVELAGEVPDDCLGEITWSPPFLGLSVFGQLMPIPTPRNVPLRGPRTRRIGPVGNEQLGVWVSVPMRNRVERTEVAISNLSAGTPRLQLPELRRFLHRGRVQLPSDVPPERVAVVARRIDQQHVLDSFATCLACDGTFELDLAAARYALQLVDLETLIVFHTDADDRTLDEGTVTDVIAITPEIHWLTVATKPTTVGAAIVDQGVTFELASPRGELPALLRASPTSTYQQDWAPRTSTRARLLVPPGKLALQASQAFQMLNPRCQSWRPQAVDHAEIEVTTREHEVTLRLPPPPSDGDIDNLAPAADRR